MVDWNPGDFNGFSRSVLLIFYNIKMHTLCIILFMLYKDDVQWINEIIP